MENIKIRKERKSDFRAVRRVNDKAFNQPQEGNVIDKIRKSGVEILSLVAVRDKEVLGHIFFSPIEIIGHREIKDGMGLAPMAVLPEYQNKKIGSMLINEGIRILKKRLVPFIIVLGHEYFYPKFGFEVASKYGLKCQWKNVPDKAFMVLILDKNRMQNIHGIARYLEEFNEAM